MRAVVWPKVRPRPPTTPDTVVPWLNFWNRDDVIAARPILESDVLAFCHVASGSIPMACGHRCRMRLVLTGPRSLAPAWLNCGDMAGPLFDAAERAQLSDLLDELGPEAPTLLAPWTTRDMAAHLVLRERDPLAGPGLVLPGAWGRLAERRRRALALRDFAWLVATLRSGPPPGVFRSGWVRRLPSLNEFFVHHEDVRRANGRGPRTNEPAMDEALWRNVSRAPWFLARRLRGAGSRAPVGGNRSDRPGPAGRTYRPYRRTSRRAAALPLRPAGRGPCRGERAHRGGPSRATRAVRHITTCNSSHQVLIQPDAPSQPDRLAQSSRAASISGSCVTLRSHSPRTSGHSHPRQASLKSPLGSPHGFC